MISWEFVVMNLLHHTDEPNSSYWWTKFILTNYVHHLPRPKANSSWWGKFARMSFTWSWRTLPRWFRHLQIEQLSSSYRWSKFVNLMSFYTPEILCVLISIPDPQKRLLLTQYKTSVWCEPGGGHSHTWSWYRGPALMTLIFGIFYPIGSLFFTP